MAMDDIDDGGAIDLERKRGINPWIVFSIVLLAIGIVFGMRRARTPKPPDSDASAAGGQS